MNRPLRPLSKQAGRVLNLVNRSIAAAESHPLGGLMGDLAKLHPSSEAALQNVKNRVQDVAQRAEAHPVYQAGRAVRDIGQEIAGIPAVQEHVVAPVQRVAAPVAQAVQQHVVAPVTQAVQNSPMVQHAQQTMQSVNEGATKAREALPHVQQIAQSLPSMEQVSQFAQQAQQHGVANAVTQHAVNHVAQQVAQTAGGFLPQVTQFLTQLAQKFKVSDPGTLRNLYEAFKGHLSSATAWGANAMQGLSNRFQQGDPAVKTSAHHALIRLAPVALSGVYDRL